MKRDMPHRVRGEPGRQPRRLPAKASAPSEAARRSRGRCRTSPATPSSSASRPAPAGAAAELVLQSGGGEELSEPLAADTARVMRFADPDEVEGFAADLTAVLKAWCKWKDA